MKPDQEKRFERPIQQVPDPIQLEQAVGRMKVCWDQIEAGNSTAVHQLLGDLRLIDQMGRVTRSVDLEKILREIGRHPLVKQEIDLNLQNAAAASAASATLTGPDERILETVRLGHLLGLTEDPQLDAGYQRLFDTHSQIIELKIQAAQAAAAAASRAANKPAYQPTETAVEQIYKKFQSRWTQVEASILAYDPKNIDTEAILERFEPAMYLIHQAIEEGYEGRDLRIIFDALIPKFWLDDEAIRGFMSPARNKTGWPSRRANVIKIVFFPRDIRPTQNVVKLTAEQAEKLVSINRAFRLSLHPDLRAGFVDINSSLNDEVDYIYRELNDYWDQLKEAVNNPGTEVVLNIVKKSVPPSGATS